MWGIRVGGGGGGGVGGWSPLYHPDDGVHYIYHRIREIRMFVFGVFCRTHY